VVPLQHSLFYASSLLEWLPTVPVLSLYSSLLHAPALHSPLLLSLLLRTPLLH
jgi:hypothetical protein